MRRCVGIECAELRRGSLFGERVLAVALAVDIDDKEPTIRLLQLPGHPS